MVSNWKIRLQNSEGHYLFRVSLAHTGIANMQGKSYSEKNCKYKILLAVSNNNYNEKQFWHSEISPFLEFDINYRLIMLQKQNPLF